MGWKRKKPREQLIGILQSQLLGPVALLKYEVERNAGGDLHLLRRGVMNWTTVDGSLQSPERIRIPGTKTDEPVGFLPYLNGKMIELKTFSQRFRDQSEAQAFDVIVHDIKSICFVDAMEKYEFDMDDDRAINLRTQLIDLVNHNLMTLQEREMARLQDLTPPATVVSPHPHSAQTANG